MRELMDAAAQNTKPDTTRESFSHRLIYWSGGFVTRFLAHPKIRSSHLCQRLYKQLYFFGKTILDLQEKKIILQFVREGMTVLDIGANIGYYTFLFSKAVGKRGKIYAFEPDPYSFTILRENVASDSLDNITIEPFAITEKKGTANLYTGKTNRADNRVYPSRDGYQDCFSVDTIAIDDYFSENVRRVDLIKIDIQGAEYLALRGMKKLLRSSPSVVLITEFAPYLIRSAGGEPVQYLKELAELGFFICRQDQIGEWINPENFDHFVAQYPDKLYTDLICARKKFF